MGVIKRIELAEGGKSRQAHWLKMGSSGLANRLKGGIKTSEFAEEGHQNKGIGLREASREAYWLKEGIKTRE